jgi:hypothetical protein
MFFVLVTLQARRCNRAPLPVCGIVRLYPDVEPVKKRPACSSERGIFDPIYVFDINVMHLRSAQSSLRHVESARYLLVLPFFWFLGDVVS